MRITFTSIASLGINELQRIRWCGEMITVKILTKKRASHFWEYDAETT